MKIKNKFFCGGGGEKRQFAETYIDAMHISNRSQDRKQMKLSPVRSEEFKKISPSIPSKKMRLLTQILHKSSNSKQDVKTPTEIIKEEILKKLNAISNIQDNNYLLHYNPNIINFQFKTGNNLSFELPFIIAKQELVTDIIGRGNTNLDNYKIRTILSSLSLLKDSEDNDYIDNLNDVAGFDKCIQEIYKFRHFSNEQEQYELTSNFYCLGKYANLKEDDESLSSIESNSSSKTIGGNPITNAYLINHHIFDNKHDFKPKCPKKANSLCFNSMYSCDNIVESQQDAKDKLSKECDPLTESRIFLNYINYFTNNDLKNFMYISFFDLNNVKLNVKLFKTMVKPSQTDYDTNIDSFMQQFTKTTNPTFFTDGVLSKGQFKYLSKFLDSFKKVIPPTEIANYYKIKNKLENIYNQDFITLNKNFNDYINKRQIISLETINDPMATDDKLYNKYFKSDKDKYSENIIETFAAITSNMTIKTDYNNIFTQDFCKNNLDFVYYKMILPTNQISFAIRFKNASFRKFIFDNTVAYNDFNVLFLEKEPNSNIYKEIIRNNNPNVFIGFDLKEYKTYNSNNRISSIINTLVHELTKGIVNITDKYLNQTVNKSEATVFIVFYYLFINNFIIINNGNFKNKSNIPPDNAIEISRVLFDLKKAGDLSKVLFAYYYTELDDTYKPTIQDKVSNGLVEIKEPTNGLIKDQLIFSSNDTLAVLSGILRNKNDIFFNMQSCYSYFSYRTSDNLKLTLYDIFSKIKLAFGTKFIRNNFDISSSFEQFIYRNNIYKNLHDICKHNTKAVILRNKDPTTSFENFIETNDISRTTHKTDDYYCKLFKLYIISYFELYFKEFYIKFIETNIILKRKITDYLFNSLTVDDRNSNIIKNITEKYIDKIFTIIDGLLKKIYTELINSTNNYIGNVITYYDTIFLKQIELYENIIQLIEQFLCFNTDETNFFINLANLNKFTSQLVNLYFVSSDETKNTTLPQIKKMDDINILIVCLADEGLAAFIANQKDIPKFNEDVLIKNLGINNFIKNLEIFDKIINNIRHLATIEITHVDIKKLFEDFIYEIEKIIYFIIIQNIIPFYFNSNKTIEKDVTIYIPDNKKFITSFIINKITENIQIAFDKAKENKIKPIKDKIKDSMRKKVKETFEIEIKNFEKKYDTKRDSILSKITDILQPKLEIFYKNDFLKNLELDEFIFFYTSPISIILDENNNLKLNYNLKALSNPINIPDDFSKIQLETITTSSSEQDIIRYQLMGIYNFLISNRKNEAMQSGGNKNKKTKKLKKY